jgi:leader peptidase (prepilin peptidase)/N-methyltransferase
LAQGDTRSHKENAPKQTPRALRIAEFLDKIMRQNKEAERVIDSSLNQQTLALRLSSIEMAMMLSGGLCAYFLLPNGEAAFAIGFWILAVVIVKSDLAAYLIPDWASLALAGLGLAHAIYLGLPSDAGLPNDDRFYAAVSSIINGLLAFGLFLAVSRAYFWLTKREGLGFGDVKLAGALGLWLNFSGFAICLQLATFAALALVSWQVWQGRRDRFAMLPLGAFLAPAAWAVHIGLSLWPDFRLVSFLSLGSA